MFCPRCRTEFRPGFTQCSDCGIALVAALRSESKREPDAQSGIDPEHVDAGFDGTVVVMDSGDPIKDAMAKGILREAGIPFYVTGEFYGTRTPGWAQILVKREYEAEAREALRLIERGRPYLL